MWSSDITKEHERRVDGFGSENEALEWIVENADQIDK